MNDETKAAWAILGFFLTLVGLMLYAVWKIVWWAGSNIAHALTPAPQLTWDVEIEDAPRGKGKRVSADELREVFGE